ncbi:MAG: hypothetical protein U9O56_04365 [Campylobacterota bacterium]|nr:hypothetical protein [Campylobacterota bacterium]
MVVENFSRNLIRSKILNTYVAAVFFAVVIFFVLNASFFSPFEMISWIVIVTIGFKGIANIMLSMSISLINLDNTENKLEFEKSSTQLETLVNDLAIQEASVQSTKNKK